MKKKNRGHCGVEMEIDQVMQQEAGSMRGAVLASWPQLLCIRCGPLSRSERLAFQNDMGAVVRSQK